MISYLITSSEEDIRNVEAHNGKEAQVNFPSAIRPSSLPSQPFTSTPSTFSLRRKDPRNPCVNPVSHGILPAAKSWDAEGLPPEYSKLNSCAYHRLRCLCICRRLSKTSELLQSPNCEAPSENGFQVLFVPWHKPLTDISSQQQQLYS